MKLELTSDCVADTGDELAVEIKLSGYPICRYELKPNSMRAAEAEAFATKLFAAKLHDVTQIYRSNEYEENS